MISAVTTCHEHATVWNISGETEANCGMCNVQVKRIQRCISSHRTSKALLPRGIGQGSHHGTSSDSPYKAANRKRRSLSMAAGRLTRLPRSCRAWGQWCTPLATRQPLTGAYWQVNITHLLDECLSVPAMIPAMCLLTGLFEHNKWQGCAGLPSMRTMADWQVQQCRLWYNVDHAA